MTVHDIPALNATLNGVATVLITIGFVLIKAGRKRGPSQGHDRPPWSCRRSSSSATSTHKILVRGVHTPFGGEGAIRTVYYVMLISHIILAISIAYLVPAHVPPRAPRSL